MGRRARWALGLLLALLLAACTGCGVAAESAPRVIPPEDVPFGLVTESRPAPATGPGSTAKP